jgi:hypothetical protein
MEWFLRARTRRSAEARQRVLAGSFLILEAPAAKR